MATRVDPQFKRPEEFEPDEPRRSVSARIRESVFEKLQTEAKKNRLNTATLIDHAVTAYIDWLERTEPKKEKVR